jgi:hypothetical protein
MVCGQFNGAYPIGLKQLGVKKAGGTVSGSRMPPFTIFSEGFPKYCHGREY